MRRNLLLLYFLSILAVVVVSCDRDESETAIAEEGVEKSSSDSLKYNPDWTYLSHGKANPDYSLIFSQKSVNKLELSMTAAQWTSIRTNLKSLFGYDFGSNTGGGGVPGGGGAPGGGPGAGGGGSMFPDNEPDYVDVNLKFNGKNWKNVGFRLKGNSSLSSGWGQGNYKLPFKLNFDKFEDKYPGIKNQHFYGFKELSFSPAFRDQSLMREKLASDIFRLAGIPTAQTAFYQVYIDFGSGQKYCGVYTVIELPEDHMIKVQFCEEKGNIYKPESKFASFSQNEFEKKNNETEADYADVKAFIAALNSSLRISNSPQWRTDLDAVFNTDHFLKYLAVSNAIVNWDSYGNMAHNFYLYNHSASHLTWIPWDHNEALSGSPGITGTGSNSSAPGRTGLSLSMNEVTQAWPLIYDLVNDGVYFQKYKSYLKQFNENIFTEQTIHSMIDNYREMISPYAIGVNGEQTGYTYLSGSTSFTSAVSDLKTHVTNRRKIISSFVP